MRRRPDWRRSPSIACAEAAELDLLDVVPGEVGEGEQRSDVLVERGRADHPGHALALEVGAGRDVGVLGGHDGEQRVGIVEHQRAHRLRAPVARAEFVDALLRQIAAADAVGRERHLAVAQRNVAGDVVLARQHAQVDLQLVLQRVADGDRLIVAAGADVIGGPGQRLGQLDVLLGRGFGCGGAASPRQRAAQQNAASSWRSSLNCC